MPGMPDRVGRPRSRGRGQNWNDKEGASSMTTFDEREKGFEAKYKHDQELQFKVGARRNKLLGLWAAELLGLSGDDAAAYAREVIESDFDEPGDDDVLRKVHGDLSAKGVDKSQHQVRKQMDELMDVARRQIMEEVTGR
jgi:hypothetical protein